MVSPTGAGAGSGQGRRILVTGGVRSGKSTHAEALLSAEPEVVYLASGPVPGPADTEWAARVQAHRRRRPVGWDTVETTDVATHLGQARVPVLWDCVGTWLTAQLDQVGAWQDRPGWRAELDVRTRTLQRSWAAAGTTVVAVTNEVGWGVVPATASGRLFADLLGWLNQGLAAGADQVHLVVAGRVLRL